MYPTSQIQPHNEFSKTHCRQWRWLLLLSYFEIKKNEIDRNEDMEILRAKEVSKKTGMSTGTIYRLERQGDFPERIFLTENIVGWKREEVEEWLEKREEKSRGSK